jgi:predicted ATPase
MLTNLDLRNFKSWEATGDVRLAPITGLFGTNSSGKTSLLQALLLLKQTSESADRGLPLQFGDPKSPANLGDFRSVIYRHANEAELGLSLSWTQSASFVAKDPDDRGKPLVESRDLSVTTKVRDESNGSQTVRLVVPEFRYGVGAAGFGMRRRPKERAEYDLFAESIAFKFLRYRGRQWPLPPPTKCYGFPDQVRAYFQNAGFLSDLELAFEEQLGRVYYLGPLRAYPERNYTWSGAQPSDMGRAGEQAIHALLSSRDRGDLISQGKGIRRVTLEQYVAEWLKRLGLIAEFRVEAVAGGSQIFQVKVRKTPGGTESLITDVGFGVSQILPVIVLCFYVPEGSTVILEQPEIHLHPAVQANLADVLIDAWDRRGVQILVESHSEHLLRRLQRRVAERKLRNNDVALYFCEATDQGSKLTPLDLDIFGNIANWPADFFGDQFGELAATQKARLAAKASES